MKIINEIYTIRMHYFILMVFYLSSSTQLRGQNWERTLGTEDNQVCVYDIVEHYDHGYLIGARLNDNIAPQGTMDISDIIYKTDINGNILWFRNYRSEDALSIRGCKMYSDGSVIVATNYFDYFNDLWDIRIYRIGVCGDILWCKHYIDPFGKGYKVFDLEIINDKIVFVRERFGELEPPKYTLVMLELDGDTYCEKPFLLKETYPLMYSPMVYKIQPLPNNELMALGAVYYPKEPGGRNWIRSMFVKFDADGNEQWMLPFGLNDTLIGMYSNCENIIVEDSGRYFAFGAIYRFPQKMLLMKFDDQGNELGHVISPIDSVFGYPHPSFNGVHKIGDNRYLNLLQYPKNESVSHLGSTLVVVDSSLNTFYDTLFTNTTKCLSFSWIKSYDDKYLLSGYDVQSNDIQGYYNKVSLDPLSFDTMYTAPYTYDSLCPDIAYADTLYFEDCELHVGENDIQFEEPTKTPLLLYPNPTHDELTVSLGKATHISTISITIHTLTGEVHWREDMLPGEQTTRLSTHSWPKGIYLVTARMGNEVVGREKVVVM
ncbi:MAG: T9SS type A sorting domain-containing protein [Bacteroidia bacterium]|nr:T9SS type A sorting domain-containing protein [Bacteroidales bacterium]MDD3011556.1 T9SS type A sorting domain-containing protein [Bacteroidales bacterium]MDD3962638.1 T9SS type A sorting domain-containing protein [Bacteroidales bacterium]MDY0286642.1 T9SS type A sorting domain-containing protein [Bacteroidales bacterium]NCD42323.1 T9SS type A sorting domain-containing protein [Bacteroidia bacterium]